MKKMNCDECDPQLMFDPSQSLKEKIWNSQLQQKEIIINGEIKDDLIEKAVIQVFNFNKIDDMNRLVDGERIPIIIYLNSVGGSMDEAFSLISAIEASKTPVITVALGKAYSAGFLILLAGHQRFAQKYSILMYHQGSAGIMGEVNRMVEYVEHWKFCQTLVEEYVLSKTKIKKKKLQEIFNGKQDWFIKTEEAKELGIIDGTWEY